jgi:adenosine deaminase
MERLILEDIALDVAVTSNVRLHAVRSPADHRVRRLYDAGVPIVVNTDDPGLLATTLNNEYALLADAFEVTAGDLHHLIDDSFDYAFLDDERRR